MTEESILDDTGICDDLHRITGFEWSCITGSKWSAEHKKMQPELKAVTATLPSLDAAKKFQHTLVDHKIHFSRYPEKGFSDPSLTFTLRPEEAQNFISSQTPSLVVESARGAEKKRAERLKT